MGKSDKVTIRLTPEQADALDELVLKNDYKNRSQALRASLDKMVNREERDPDIVDVKLDNWVKLGIEGLVAIGMYDSFDSAVRHFLREALIDLNVDEVQARPDWLKKWGQKTSSTQSMVESAFRDYVKK